MERKKMTAYELTNPTIALRTWYILMKKYAMPAATRARAALATRHMANLDKKAIQLLAAQFATRFATQFAT
jgi:hypothetical protein